MIEYVLMLLFFQYDVLILSHHQLLHSICRISITALRVLDRAWTSMNFGIFQQLVVVADKHQMTVLQCIDGVDSLKDKMTLMESATFIDSSEEEKDKIVNHFTKAADVSKVKYARDPSRLKSNSGSVSVNPLSTESSSLDDDADMTIDRATNKRLSQSAKTDTPLRDAKKAKFDTEEKDDRQKEGGNIDSAAAKEIKQLKSLLRKTTAQREFYKKECHILKDNRQQMSYGKADHPIAAWIHSAKPLSEGEQGAYAECGTAIFVKHPHPIKVIDLTEYDMSVLPERAPLCFYKRSFVKSGRTAQFNSEHNAMVAIKRNPSVHLPTVYACNVGMLIGLQHDGMTASHKRHQQVIVCGVTEYMRGMSLDAWLNDAKEGERIRSMPDRQRLMELLQIILQLVRGLRHAHEIGIIHRDVKINNVMIMSPAIYCILQSTKNGLRTTSNKPYPEDEESGDSRKRPTRSTCVKPTSGEAKRSLYANGYAPTFSFDDKVNHPTAGSDVPKYRVVLIDFNTSVMSSVARYQTIDAAQQYILGVPEYVKKTTEVQSKAYTNYSVGDWKELPDPDLTTAVYWEQYDNFGLVMTILDVLRGCPMEFDTNLREASILKFRKSYFLYCKTALAQYALPSVYKFMRLQSNNPGNIWRWDSLEQNNLAGTRLLEHSPNLQDVLHRATASRWESTDGNAVQLYLPIPSLADIENAILEELAQKSVSEKMTAYKLDVITNIGKGDCIYHAFKQQADVARQAAIDTSISVFPPDLTRMLDGPVPSSSSSSTSSSSSSSVSPAFDYVTSIRQGLVDWLTARMVSGESQIINGLVQLHKDEPKPSEMDAAAIDTAMSDIQIIPPQTDAQKEQNYACHKLNVQKATRIHMNGEWNRDSLDSVVEYLALMFNVSVLIIFARSGDSKQDMVLNPAAAKEGRPMMKVYKTVGHYEGTKSR